MRFLRCTNHAHRVCRELDKRGLNSVFRDWFRGRGKTGRIVHPPSSCAARNRRRSRESASPQVCAKDTLSRGVAGVLAVSRGRFRGFFARDPSGLSASRGAVFIRIALHLVFPEKPGRKFFPAYEFLHPCTAAARLREQLRRFAEPVEQPKKTVRSFRRAQTGRAGRRPRRPASGTPRTYRQPYRRSGDRS